MSRDEVFNNLRQKLDVLGYNQSLPLASVSLVSALLEDLVKTTESLRDAKIQISKLFEEKSCWELGVEPYKCDNSKLLAECNTLHMELLKQRDEFQEQLCEYAKKIRNLESDKRCLEDHCIELESQIRELTLRYSDEKSLKSKKDGLNMSKKPFVSTVKSGIYLPDPIHEHTQPIKCTKCNNVVWSKQNAAPKIEIEKLQNEIKEKADKVALFKKKVEERDREIGRLNELLTGGRPAAALAKDCCYKNVECLSEDLEKLQRDKVENLRILREVQTSMHEAKQRAIYLAERNEQLEQELKDLKDAALSVEDQANKEIAKKECEINKLTEEIKKLKKQLSENVRDHGGGTCIATKSQCCSADEKWKLNERLNELILREKELEGEIERITKKNTKLRNRLDALQKESDERSSRENKLSSTALDEERIRLKSERDLFQKEYLRLIEKAGSSTETYILRSELKEKENEINNLRSEISQLRMQTMQTMHQAMPISREKTPNSCISVQTAILRAERERDAILAQLDCIKAERDGLKEKLQCSIEVHLSETTRLCKEIEQLKMKICELEKENREFLTIQIPGETRALLMREEIDELKKRLSEVQLENCKLNTNYNQLKILHEQTERALVAHQNKLAISETNLRNAESRLDVLSTNRDTTREEVSSLRNEITYLKKANTILDNEKDKIMVDLDIKTEKLYKMENELKSLKRKNDELELLSSDLQDRLNKVTTERKDRETELHETSTERKSLRQQVNTLKEVRDRAIAENGRLSNELADVKAEVNITKRKLKDSEKEVERLKEQLQQYVQKVQKAENLLLQKECEREEMLEHYRLLSHDAIVLEGNNQSLEMEASEHKRQLLDAEEEIVKLKKELRMKETTIDKLEQQVTILSGQICSLEKELQQSYDDQKLLKVDIEALRELCDKLDLKTEKLNAELEEKGEIISKLEKDNSELRRNIMESSYTDKAATEALQDELERERKTIRQLTQEQLDLRRRIKEIEKQLEQERGKVCQSEALANEYNVQIHEMQHNLTDERFKNARNREESSCSRSPRSHLPNNSGCLNRLKSRHNNETNEETNLETNRAYPIKTCKNLVHTNKTRIHSNEENSSKLKKFENGCCKKSNLSSTNSEHNCLNVISKRTEGRKHKDIVKDINKFSKDKCYLSNYDEIISFDEDNDDIIVRKIRKITIKTIAGEEKYQNQSKKDEFKNLHNSKSSTGCKCNCKNAAWREILLINRSPRLAQLKRDLIILSNNLSLRKRTSLPFLKFKITEEEKKAEQEKKCSEKKKKSQSNHVSPVRAEEMQQKNEDKSKSSPLPQPTKTVDQPSYLDKGTNTNPCYALRRTFSDDIRLANLCTQMCTQHLDSLKTFSEIQSLQLGEKYDINLKDTEDDECITTLTEKSSEISVKENLQSKFEEKNDEKNKSEDKVKIINDEGVNKNGNDQNKKEEPYKKLPIEINTEIENKSISDGDKKNETKVTKTQSNWKKNESKKNADNKLGFNKKNDQQSGTDKKLKDKESPSKPNTIKRPTTATTTVKKTGKELQGSKKEEEKKKDEQTKTTLYKQRTNSLRNKSKVCGEKDELNVSKPSKCASSCTVKGNNEIRQRKVCRSAFNSDNKMNNVQSCFDINQKSKGSPIIKPPVTPKRVQSKVSSTKFQKDKIEEKAKTVKEGILERGKKEQIAKTVPSKTSTTKYHKDKIEEKSKTVKEGIQESGKKEQIVKRVPSKTSTTKFHKDKIEEKSKTVKEGIQESRNQDKGVKKDEGAKKNEGEKKTDGEKKIDKEKNSVQEKKPEDEQKGDEKQKNEEKQNNEEKKKDIMELVEQSKNNPFKGQIQFCNNTIIGMNEIDDCDDDANDNSFQTTVLIGIKSKNCSNNPFDDVYPSLESERKQITRTAQTKMINNNSTQTEGDRNNNSNNLTTFNCNQPTFEVVDSQLYFVDENYPKECDENFQPMFHEKWMEDFDETVKPVEAVPYETCNNSLAGNTLNKDKKVYIFEDPVVDDEEVYYTPLTFDDYNELTLAEFTSRKDEREESGRFGGIQLPGNVLSVQDKEIEDPEKWNCKKSSQIFSTERNRTDIDRSFLLNLPPPPPPIIYRGKKREPSKLSEFTGCRCTKSSSFDNMCTITDGKQTVQEETIYSRTSVVCKRSNNRIEQVYLAENGIEKIRNDSETSRFNIAAYLPPPPIYEGYKAKK